MTLLDRQKEVTKCLVAGFPSLGLKGVPLKSACAAVGNFTQENLVKAVTEGVKDHGSDGLAQWRLTRLDGPHGLKGWSEAQGLDWATLSAQAAFFLWELHRDYPALERDLRAATKSIETLTANICKFYERPNMAVAALDKRISHAKSVYAIMSKEQTAKMTTQAGAGAAVVIGTATMANAANGGSIGMTLVGVALAGAAAIIGPLFAHFTKPKDATPTAPAPVAAKIDHIDAVEARPSDDPTMALNAAIARRKSAEAMLAAAVAVEAEERNKIVARLDALRTAISAAGIVAPAEDHSEGQPS